MEPAFGHPLWISSGVLMMLVGFLLFRWARRDNAADHVAKATREAVVNKMLKGGGPSSRGAHRPKSSLSIIFAGRWRSFSGSSDSC